MTNVIVAGARTPIGRLLGGLTSLSAAELGSIAITLAVVLAVYLFFRFTSIGLAMRAAAQNPVSSRLVGIRVGQSVQLAGQRERIGEVVPREWANLDAWRARHGEAADRAVGIAEAHAATRSGWRLSTDHIPPASPAMSTTSVARPSTGPCCSSASAAADCTRSARAPSASPTVRCGITSAWTPPYGG